MADLGESGKYKLTLGCDPEVALVNGRKSTIRAADIFGNFDPSGKDGGAGAKFGVDGAGVSAELRPGVALSPLGLLVRCRVAVQLMMEEIRRMQGISSCGVVRGVRAGSYVKEGNPLGGHVHAGGLTQESAADFGTWAGAVALTWWYGVDDIAEREARWDAGYGTDPFEVRVQPHGLEYRPMGSWMANPRLALAAVSLVKVAAVAVLEGNFPPSVKFFRGGNSLWSQDWPAWVDGLDLEVPVDCRAGMRTAKRLWARGRQDMTQNLAQAWGVGS